MKLETAIETIKVLCSGKGQRKIVLNKSSDGDIKIEDTGYYKEPPEIDPILTGFVEITKAPFK